MPSCQTQITVQSLACYKPGMRAGNVKATSFALTWVLLIALAAIVLNLSAATIAYADKADVIDARITPLGDGRYRIDATVKHADTGWDHYADRWDVVAEDGTVLGVRELAHPHENEQPFTRSLTLTIPEGVKKIILRANDSVHELGGQEFEIMVP